MMSNEASKTTGQQQRTKDDHLALSKVVAVANANRILKAKIPIEKKQKQKKVKEVELIGKSWAADCTAFVIPSLDLALDAGYPVHGKRMSCVLITHCHTDHCHYMTHLKSRTKPPQVYLPQESKAQMNNFIHAAQQLTSNLTPKEYDAISWDTSYVLNGVRGGDGQRIVLNKKRGLICHVISCDHGVPCVGYCVSRIKQSLKAEYVGLSGKEIGELRKKGNVEVTTQVEEPMFCFLGDTTVSILNGPDAKRIFACPTIIIECTFLTPDCRDNAARSKHVLWTDLKPFILEHSETTFVLTHFSHRWTTQEIQDFFRNENLPNVIPWVPSGDVGLYCRPVGDQEEEIIDEVWSHF